MRRVAFLDRDGVLIQERHHLGDPEGVALIEGVPAALRRLRAAGYSLVLVSNQAGLAKGKFSEEDLTAVHARLVACLAAEGVTLDAARYCPHHPAGVVASLTRRCRCRKPAPGLLELEEQEGGPIDRARSFLVGDKRSDLEAGQAFGVESLLVRTGHGEEEAPLCPPGTWIAADLPAAVAAWLERHP